jgi:large conductance mechanosensitive channel
MTQFFREFRDFISKGNVVDLAVGVMIGAAFNSVVTALVKDMVTPPISLLLNRVNFSDLFFALDGRSYPNLAAAQAANAPVLLYGDFLSTVISFLITALIIFLIVRQINAMRRWRAKGKFAPAPTTKKCQFCATEIPKEAKRCPHCTSELN